ncbi:Uncharacterised protein [Enterobacter cloacae]|uniref:Uncharacterized protein n=1 Tax=Enterobacter cloacae TaxID=550 RepID=A0A377LMJ3_ENTCL|nr:Uncharacterised protein [Enterobacter cloacae]
MLFSYVFNSINVNAARFIFAKEFLYCYIIRIKCGFTVPKSFLNFVSIDRGCISSVIGNASCVEIDFIKYTAKINFTLIVRDRLSELWAKDKIIIGLNPQAINIQRYLASRNLNQSLAVKSGQYNPYSQAISQF